MVECKKCHSENTFQSGVHYKQVQKNGKEWDVTAMGTICIDCGYFCELGGGWTPGWWITDKELEKAGWK